MVSLVDEAVHRLASRMDIPVVSSYLELVEGRLIQDGITALEDQGVTDIVVIPLFVSSGKDTCRRNSLCYRSEGRSDMETDLAPFRVRSWFILARRWTTPPRLRPWYGIR